MTEQEEPNLHQNILSAAKGIALHPMQFFKTMPTEGGFIEPLKFCAVMFAISASTTILLGVPFIWVPGLWIAAILIEFISAGLFYLSSKLLGGKGTYEGTFRALAYSSFTSICSSIPILGMGASIYGVVLTAFGLMRAHELSSGKAIFAVVLPLIVLFVGGIGIGTVTGFMTGMMSAHH